MKNLKCLLAVVLMLALAMSMCACGGNTEEPAAEAPAVTEAPVVTEEPAAETKVPAEEEEGGYTVTVLDDSGNPIAGAMVQLCKDACVPGVTDAEGIVKFNLPEDEYKVSFLALPAGYTYVDETQEFHFADGSMEMTITLKAE